MKITKLLLVLKPIIFRIAFISWLMFVTFSSLSSFEGVDVSYINIPHFDKIVHFGFYFVMVVLGVFAFDEQFKNRFGPQKGLIFMLIFAIAYGVIIEVLQAGFTANRQGDVLDAIANTLGALSGMWIGKSLFSNRWPLK
ncbi:hypothetical protein EJ994_09820 [Maribacter sp. MJ134]|nr:hypothetical protein EJ994_09820 [Maribacter sp. MJ134]